MCMELPGKASKLLHPIPSIVSLANLHQRSLSQKSIKEKIRSVRSNYQNDFANRGMGGWKEYSLQAANCTETYIGSFHQRVEWISDSKTANISYMRKTVTVGQKCAIALWRNIAFMGTVCLQAHTFESSVVGLCFKMQGKRETKKPPLLYLSEKVLVARQWLLYHFW